MIGALVLRNIHHQRWLFGALLFGVFAMEIFMVAIGASLTENAGLTQMFEAMPPAFRSLIGSQLSEISFAALVGFGFQHPAVFAMGLAFVLLVATAPAAERESGFLDLVLVRPLPRSRYLAAIVVGMVAGAVLLAVAQLLGLIVGLAIVEVPDEPGWAAYVASAGGQIAFLLSFGGVALLAATNASRRGTAVAWVVGLILVCFVVEAFSSLYTPLEYVRWLSPFHYFQPVRSALSGTSILDPLLLVGVFALTTTGAFVRFARRDV